MMKKIFLFVCIFLAFSTLASAQRIDVATDVGGYKVVMFKAKVLKHTADTSNKMLNFYYEPSEQALYVSAHGDAHGRLYLQKNRRIGETVSQCVDRLIKENESLFSNLKISKVYLLACYEESRHKDNLKDLFIGHSDTLNVDMYEISRYNSYLEACFRIENNIIYALEYDMTYSNPLRDKEIYKQAKKAAEENSAAWAVEMLKNNKQF